MVREEDVKQLKDVLRFFVHRTSEAREDDPKHREEVCLLFNEDSGLFGVTLSQKFRYITLIAVKIFVHRIISYWRTSSCHS